MLELRAVRGCIAKCLAQLAAWILPPAALPIALPVALPAITIGGARKAAKIRSERSRPVPIDVELLGRHPPWKRPLLRPNLQEISSEKRRLQEGCWAWATEVY
jgi:hypothetical protein